MTVISEQRRPESSQSVGDSEGCREPGRRCGVLHGGSAISFARGFLRARYILSPEPGPRESKPVKTGPVPSPGGIGRRGMEFLMQEGAGERPEAAQGR